MRLGLPGSLVQEGRQRVLVSEEHEGPVHTLITALESVGDNILSHRQCQPPVCKEPRLLSLPSKVRESAVTDFVLALGQNHAKVRKARAAGRNSSFGMRVRSTRDRSAVFTLTKKNRGH